MELEEEDELLIEEAMQEVEDIMKEAEEEFFNDVESTEAILKSIQPRQPTMDQEQKTGGGGKYKKYYGKVPQFVAKEDPEKVLRRRGRRERKVCEKVLREIEERISSSSSKAQLFRDTCQRKIEGLLEEVGGLKDQVEDLREENEELENALKQTMSNQPMRIQPSTTSASSSSSSSQPIFSKMNQFKEGDQEDDEGLGLGSLEGRGVSYLSFLIAKIMKYIYKLLPLQHDLVLISSRFGSSVASYYFFFRWIIVVFGVIFGATLLVFLSNKASYQLMVKLGNSQKPSILLFDSIVSNPYSSLGGDLIQVGFWTCSLSLLLMALFKLVFEHKVALQLTSISAETDHIKFGKVFLGAWDHSITSEEEVENLKLTNEATMALMLEEHRIVKTIESRTRWEILCLFTWRSLGMVVYLILQIIAWGVIFILATSNKYAAYSSVGITLVNSIMPVFIKIITNAEKWDSAGTAINLQLTRMFFAKMINVMIQFIKLALLMDSSLESVFPFFTIPTQDSCPINDAILTLGQLILAEFFVGKMIKLGMVMGKQIVAKIRGVGRKKEEFDMAKSMVSLLYFVALSLGLLPLQPMIACPIFLLLILSFKFEKFILLSLSSKPQRPWKSDKAALIFVQFFLVVVIGIFFPFLIIFIRSKSISQCTSNTSLPATPLSIIGITATGVWKWLKEPLITFSIAILLLIGILLRENNILVLHKISGEKEKHWKTEMAALNVKIKKQTKTITRMKESQDHLNKENGDS